MIKLSNDAKLTKRFMRLNWERLTMETVRNIFIGGGTVAYCACQQCMQQKEQKDWGATHRPDGTIAIGCVDFSSDDIAIIKTHLQLLDLDTHR